MSTFDLDRIAASGLIGTIDFHDLIGSTNDRALELGSREELQLPTLVLAEMQTAGRGRGTNRWMAGAGALTFSLILEAPADRLPARRWPQVALAAGVAVRDALDELAGGANVRVKWPNDVYLSRQKICGILSESVPGLSERLVVGVGLNVNNTVSAAISLIEHDGVLRDLTAVLLTILDEFDRRWRQLVSDRFDEIAADYRRKCFLTGKSVRIEQAGGRIVAGICRGIDEEGMLVVQTESGIEKVVSGTVSDWAKENVK